ncbi:hypothetical protein B0J13DRAFT_673892 [Dactylonectria estremocensis]|uniref:Uncharacterized protein n=1 Tax=Dactylonectria estremocensis TaxID=1079267 RepID=A0A9P9JBL5_9HYPO|nr:hypothetical protein B0J13DRAFT_673892 [Dactylonectria estremocensis]
MRCHSFTALWAILASATMASLIRAPDMTHIVSRNPLSGEDLALSPLALKYGLTPRDLHDGVSSSLVTRGLFDTSVFSFSKENELLFDGALPLDDGLEIEFSLTCIDCQASATLTPSFESAGIFNYLDSVVNLTFADTSAYIDLDLIIDGDGTYTYPIWTSNGATGIDIDIFSIGLFLSVELVLDISDAIDIQGGFEYSIPDGSFISVDLSGDILAQNFDGANFVEIPWQYQSGSATIKAALVLRVECGAQLSIAGNGLELEVGIYLSIPEIVLQFEATETCGLETTEWLDINAGVYAREGLLVDGTLLGEAPTASTTFYSLPLGTQCWDTLSTSQIAATTQPIEVPETSEAASVVSTWLVGGGDPITSTTSPTFIVSGGPPVFASTMDGADATSVKQTTASPSKWPSIVPGKYSNTTAGVSDFHTSTVYSTKVYTITSCAASVINCPATWRQEIVVTKEIELYTTVCPITETQTVPVVATTSRVPRNITLTNGTPVPACPTPIINTFVPPADRSPPAERTKTIFVHVPITKVVTQSATSTASTTVLSSGSEGSCGEVITSDSTEAAKPTFTHGSNVTAVPSQVSEVPVSSAARTSLLSLIGGITIVISCLLAL